MVEDDKIYYDKEEIEQYELTIKEIEKGIKEEYKKPNIVIYTEREADE